MDNILLNVSAVVVALVVSYFVFWYRNHKNEIDSKRAKGDALAFVVDTLGQVATNIVYDLKDSSEKVLKRRNKLKSRLKISMLMQIYLFLLMPNCLVQLKML